VRAGAGRALPDAGDEVAPEHPRGEADPAAGGGALQHHEGLRTPEDLARHTLLHDDDPIDLEAVGWPQWLAAAGEDADCRPETPRRASGGRSVGPDSGRARAGSPGPRRGRDHVLTVSTTHSFASLWLIPRIGSFRARHPDLECIRRSERRPG
jgi:hypothetical protein